MVKRTLRGDNNAYTELVRTHQARAIATAHHLTGDFEAAQDIAQEAFVQAYQSLHNLRKPAAFGGWLHGIIRNMCRRYLARRPPQAASHPSSTWPQASARPHTVSFRHTSRRTAVKAPAEPGPFSVAWASCRFPPLARGPAQAKLPLTAGPSASKTYRMGTSFDSGVP